MIENSKPILFFDGMCGLCDHFVSYVFNKDRKHQFLFAPLQGSTAKKLLSKEFTENLSTVVLLDGDKTFIKANAAREILIRLGGLTSVLAQAAQFVPSFLQLHFYDLVSSNRYSIFGKLEVCRIPLENEKPFFLD